LSGYLLDTNHCSFLLKGHPSLIRKMDDLGDAPAATCVIVEGELVFMAHKSDHPSANAQRVSQFLRGIEVLPLDRDTADRYGELKAAVLERFGPREKARRKRTRLAELGFQENDLWIAAVAQRHGLTLVSADSDFARLSRLSDIAVENWLAE
jgi:tRNA(fMet)-specific endonuclease VapC